jgi:hypothetical protein
MVNRTSTLVSWLVAFAAIGSALGMVPSQDSPAVDPASEEVRAALSTGNYPSFGSATGSYPWYDREKDQVKPPRVPWNPRFNFNLRGLGQVLTILGFAVALGALVAGLVWLWRQYEPSPKEAIGPAARRGAPSRVESLPEGMRREFESLDPWEEALRRRDRGDRLGSVVCLFAHQLLTLSKLGLLRLASGRTGRQLVRSVADAEFRALIAPTLRVFEAAYYGQRPPSDEEFADVWANAEAFERRVAAGVVA